MSWSSLTFCIQCLWSTNSSCRVDNTWSVPSPFSWTWCHIDNERGMGTISAGLTARSHYLVSKSLGSRSKWMSPHLQILRLQKEKHAPGVSNDTFAQVDCLCKASSVYGMWSAVWKIMLFIYFHCELFWRLDILFVKENIGLISAHPVQCCEWKGVMRAEARGSFGYLGLVRLCFSFCKLNGAMSHAL